MSEEIKVEFFGRQGGKTKAMMEDLMRQNARKDALPRECLPIVESRLEMVLDYPESASWKTKDLRELNSLISRIEDETKIREELGEM